MRIGGQVEMRLGGQVDDNRFLVIDRNGNMIEVSGQQISASPQLKIHRGLQVRLTGS